MNEPLTQTNLTCTKCGYLLDGISLREHCPECGIKIVNECFWCDYDLSNTAPDSKCPECGVPVFASIGQGVLATVPYEKLKNIHAGMKLVTVLILVYIVTSVTAGIAAGAMSATMNSTTLYGVVVVGSTINNAILLAIVYGWHKVATPISEIPNQLDERGRRSFLNVMSWIFAAATALTLILNLIPRNYTPTTNPSFSAIDIIAGLLGLATLVIMVIYFVAQVRYIGWIAKLVRNRKMERRAKHLVWSGPLMSILGFIILFIGPLIALILYWNMIEYTRRDLKKIVQRAERLA